MMDSGRFQWMLRMRLRSGLPTRHAWAHLEPQPALQGVTGESHLRASTRPGLLRRSCATPPDNDTPIAPPALFVVNL